MLLALSITVVISLNTDDIFAYWAERKTETETAFLKKRRKIKKKINRHSKRFHNLVIHVLNTYFM